ncbi:hypothetical protein JK361_26295 [Streptomyces sp. 5-8]|uniref:AG1 protein n=1 Tax=Streptomyces musisoli TaxID=2802280 RepID=A0ABS1P6Y8_9ACTN|nr:MULTISPECIES: hypothetical protein [Streptomyces]MBL1108058.1 hypothetical protein [Streptomyces musisoli]MBY8841423.1 hypothetical protein [Streptomyces sp. SP2-10]
MAWDEWEQLKADAAQGQSAHMQLNHVDPGGGAYGSTYLPSKTGDLKVGHKDLEKIGGAAHHLYNQLWDKARVATPSSDSAAGDLSKQGFALGAGLQHVSDRWEEQLKSLMDACAQISNHMQTTKAVHANDEHYIQRQMSSIDALDDGFDEQVGAPGKKNDYGDDGKGKGKKKE